jgi:anaerobic magnesium-protoporphyrin IX monomethyl ester cyclase
VSQSLLFVRPPRPLWPFNGPSTAVWPPLAFASLASALRDGFPELQTTILDAPALHMGWRSLEAELLRLRPDYVGIGEEAVTCAEGMRLARLAKVMGAKVIAGGCFFGHVAREAIGTGLVDAVVHGEGELTIVELMQAMSSGTIGDLHRVCGISFAADGEVMRTPPRPLLADLDRLPFPAYDLLPIARYGSGSRNHPDLAAIELGRGCVGSCAFCVLWRQMGQQDGSILVPRLRTKSAERVDEEILLLTRKYGRRYLGWVDPSFNADPDVPRGVAERLLRANRQIGQSAWVRADGLVRDAASGALESCVRAGLNEVHIGIERGDAESLQALNKNVKLETCRRALEILARDYPGVFKVGSFVYGLPGDTPDTVRKLHELSSELGLDHPFFIPLTPLPGTEFWRPEMWDPAGERFRGSSFLPGAGGARGALERALVFSSLFNWNAARRRTCTRALLHPNPRTRRMSRRLIVRAGGFEARRFWRMLTGGEECGGMSLPSWYES